MNTWYSGRSKWHWSQGAVLHHQSDEDWQANHVQHDTYAVHLQQQNSTFGIRLKRDWTVRGHFHREKISWVGQCIVPIYNKHRHIHLRITGRREVSKILHSSRTKNWLQVEYVLITDWTVSLRLIHPRTWLWRVVKAHKRWKKDWVRSDKLQTRRVRDWHIIRMNLTYLVAQVYLLYLGWVILKSKQRKL